MKAEIISRGTATTTIEYSDGTAWKGTFTIAEHHTEDDRYLWHAAEWELREAAENASALAPFMTEPELERVRARINGCLAATRERIDG